MKTIEEAGTTVLVRRQFVSGKDEGPIEESDDTMEVHRFITEPARISWETGGTFNMGNYESARVSVQITVPCYREELHEAIAYARGMASDLLASEVQKIKVARAKKDPF